MKIYILTFILISFSFLSMIDIYADSISDLTDEKENLEEELKITTEGIEDLNNSISQLETEIDDLNTNIITTEENIDYLTEEINLKSNDIASTTDQLGGYLVYSQQHDVSTFSAYRLLSKDNSENNRLFYSFVIIQQEFNEKIESLTAELLAFQDQEQQLQNQKNTLNEEKISLNTKNEELAVEIEKLENNSDSIKKQLASVEDDIIEYKLVNSNISDDKEKIMAEAGISKDDYSYVDYIVSHESSWNYSAENSTSGAYGLCQALPPTKMSSTGKDWKTNPVTQLIWCDNYAHSRYGSWESAYNFWVDNNWW